jgi:hypothetical protein
VAILEIKIQDKIIDLYDEEKIVQSFSLINIQDITKRESEYSNTFKVPRTNNNLQALDYIDFLNSNSLLPYSRLDCQILIDGFLFKNGFVSVESIEEDITLQFYTGNAGFYEIIKTKELSDINTDNTPSLETTWNLSNVISKRSSNEGIFFPMVDYNGMPTSTTNVDVRLLLPSFYRKTLIEAIIEDAGYTLVNNIGTDTIDAYNHDIIPTATNKLYNDQDTIDSNFYKGVDNYRNRNLSVATKEFTVPVTTFDLSYTGYDLFKYDFVEGNLNTFTNVPNGRSYFTSSVAGDYNVNINFNISAVNTFRWGNYANTLDIPRFIANTTIRFYLRIGNREVQFHQINNNFENPANIIAPYINSTFSDVINYSGKINVNQGEQVSIRVNVSCVFADSNVTYAPVGNVRSNVLVQCAKGDTFQIKLADSLAFNGIVNPAGCLRGIKQSEFLKDTLIRYCLIPIVDEDNKKVTLFEFNQIKDNISNAVDWSGKLDETNEKELTFKIDTYGQNNYLNHKEDKFVLQLPQGSNGIITIGNQNLELNKDLYESPFAASETVTRLNGKKVMYINLHDGVSLTTTESFKNDVQARTGYTSKENFTVTYTDGITSTVVSNDIPLTWFIDSAKNYNAGFQYLLDFSIDLIAILQNLKLVKADIRLNILDIINLNYFYPIYISEFNSYFFLSKINQFDYTSNESTKVELIKLN